MAHTLDFLLEQIINDGIVAAQRDYRRVDQEAQLEGSVAGFEECRGKSVQQLKDLLDEARYSSRAATRLYTGLSTLGEDVDAVWRLRCRELEIEWTCNVISAALYMNKMPTIITPTLRAITKAQEILGR